ncbi:hypothetical protein VaNZ11_017199 [Volvox africanus]|uniref:TOG domain-containing protein n=1 Tax=Volvox africanus TaxID=51714 RepID=A0ABQ5SP60_9CHLO|nr:hypothetical protein VaNZ11_017199 [Volvox africanus]
MTSGVPEAFGFVPAHVVADLQDIGNWKSRATAIDVLHKCLNGVSSPATLVPALADFVNFLAGLVADPNFKIAISSMSILGDLAAKVGSELGPHLRTLVPALLEKFADSKVLVRSSIMKLVRRLMAACTPSAVLTLLAAGSSHSNWRVREEVLNTTIMALLSFGPGSYDPVAAYQVLSGGLSDGKDKVRLVALEGMAVLHSRLSSGELEALMSGQRAAAGLSEQLRTQVAARLDNPALPGINAEGLVEHVVEMPTSENPDLRLADAAFGGGSSGGAGSGAGGKVPWSETSTPARPRLRVSATADGPVAGALVRPAPTLEQVGRLGSDPLPGCRRDGGPVLDNGRGGGGGLGSLDDPGIISPAYRQVGVQPFVSHPTRFGFHEPLAGGAPITAAPTYGANGWGHHGRSNLGDRAPSPCRESSGAMGGVGPGSTDSLQDMRLCGGGVGPHGSFGHAHAHGHASTLQPLKHHWGASRSMESHSVMTGKSPADNCEDCPLSPTRGYTTLMHNRHSGPAVTGDACQRDILDLLTRPASVRTQAAAELQEPRGPPLHSHTHPPAQQPHPQQHLGPPQQQPGSSSSSTGWLQSSLEQEPAVTRQETFSPSKAEMLARLKNRQIEKRAATAQQLDASSSSLASEVAAVATSTHSFTAPQNPRRYVFTQFSDLQRDRNPERSSADRDGDRCSGSGLDRVDTSSRGYDSTASTPTRAPGPLVSPCPFDEGLTSAQGHRPLRGGLAARLGRGPAAPVTAAPETLGSGSGVGGAGGPPISRSPTLPAGAHASSSYASEESPARNPSPSPAGLNRLRVRSADTNPITQGTAGGGGAAMIPATPIANGGSATPGVYWEKGRAGDGVTEDLAPLADPEKHIRLVISRLVEANHADRKELDWQGQYEALVDARRLVKHHAEVVRTCLPEFMRAATPAIDQLRSQTAKCALTLFQECFGLLGRAMDRVLDEMVPVLLKKAGDVSNAGRDNFLAAEADRALAEMYRCCGESRAVLALLGCAGHRNPYVRGKVAFHLDSHLEACAGGGGGRQALVNNTACLERLFRAAAGFLEEGSLDTRTHGKRIIWHVKGMLSNRVDFDRLVAGISPEGLQRKVMEVVELLNGPPPPPSRGIGGTAAGGIGSRLASRQPGGSGGVGMMMMGGGGGGGNGLPSPARPLLEQVAGSLTQPPPPVRQGSYSAPSPMHSGGVTPERRRLARQRTTDLDGIPESNGNSRNTSSNGRSGRLSAGAATAIAAVGSASASGGSTSANVASAGGRARPIASADGNSGSGFGPGVVEVVVKALQLLSAKDFRERMEALRSVEGVAAALPGAPDNLLMQVLDALVARLSDANAKVATLALQLVASLASSLRHRMALGLNTLVPALAAALGSTNDKVRTVAASATDALVGAMDPSMLVQHFSHCVANGTLQRGKPLLAEKLVRIVTAMYGSKPQLVSRYAVPAVFALLNDGRGGLETKAAASVLLAGLARQMGPALLEQAASLNAVAQQRVADAVAGAIGQTVNGSGGGGGGAGGDGGGERDRTPRMMMRTVA